MICCFLDDDFRYRGRDRTTGKTWDISQTKALKRGMKLKFNEIKRVRKNSLKEKVEIPREKVKVPKETK